MAEEGFRVLRRPGAPRPAPDPSIADAIRRDRGRFEEMTSYFADSRRNLGPGEAELAVNHVDMRDVVFAEIEMKQRRSENYVSDYDPFAETWTTDENARPDASPLPYAGPFPNADPIADQPAVIARRRSFYDR